jgi:O-antigen/teichoic acid export membrane protein
MLSSALFIAFTILLLGKQYTLNLAYILLSSLGISLYTLFQVHYSIVSMEGEKGALSALSCILSVLPIALILQIILIRSYLIPGAMVAAVVTNLLLVISIHYFRRFARSEREGAPIPGAQAG